MLETFCLLDYIVSCDKLRGDQSWLLRIVRAVLGVAACRWMVLNEAVSKLVNMSVVIVLYIKTIVGCCRLVVADCLAR